VQRGKIFRQRALVIARIAAGGLRNCDAYRHKNFRTVYGWWTLKRNASQRELAQSLNSSTRHVHQAVASK
jgi:hypothetical protein